MPTALITGSAGFVGRHLLAELGRRGYDTLPLDIKDDPAADAMRLHEWPSPTDGYDLAIHCAAVVGGRAKIDGAPLEVAYDFGLDSAFIQWCAVTRPKRVVLFSSSAVYPVAMQQATGHNDLSENHQHPFAIQGQPDGVYGMCKLALEYQARELRRLGLKVHVFRPFSGYGADQDDGYPFPAIMKRVLAHEDLNQPFEIWSDPHQTRDWIHIDDIVQQVFAVIQLGERVDAGDKFRIDPYEPINLCTGIPTPFRLLVELAFRLLHHPTAPRVVQKPDMPSGVHYRVGNASRIKGVRSARIPLTAGTRMTLGQIAGQQRNQQGYGLIGREAAFREPLPSTDVL